MEYNVVYSSRKTLGITVKDGKVTVRAPRGLSETDIDALVKRHYGWIEKKLKEESRRPDIDSLDADSVKKLRASANDYFLEKTREYAAMMGLKYGRITITSAKKRFGSCSSSGNICFSYRLMFYPEAAREYVIVHELAHILEMNHSPRFYRVIEKYMPDYKQRKKLLR